MPHSPSPPIASPPIASPPIASPCINICVIAPAAGLCTGCYRTLDEIAGWSSFSPAARTEIMAALPARKALLQHSRPQSDPASR